jgi:hypothetical protein
MIPSRSLLAAHLIISSKTYRKCLGKLDIQDWIHQQEASAELHPCLEVMEKKCFKQDHDTLDTIKFDHRLVSLRMRLNLKANKTLKENIRATFWERRYDSSMLLELRTVFSTKES